MTHYSLIGKQRFVVTINLSEDVELTSEEAEDINERVDTLVQEYLNYDEEVEAGNFCGFSEGINGADYDYDFDFSTIVRGHGTLEPATYWEPAEWDDEWENGPDSIDTKAIMVELKKKIPVSKVSYYFDDEIDNVEYDWD